MATLTKLNNYVEEITRLHESATQGADDLIKLGRLLDDAKESGEYRHESPTFSEWCKLHWGWSANYVGRIRRAGRFVEAQKLLEDTGHDVEVPETEGAARKAAKKSVPNATAVIEVSSEVQSNLSNDMSAKQDGEVEYAARVPLPVAVAAVRPPVSAALYNEIHAIVNYCKKAESKEPGIIHFAGYRHLVEMLKQLENRVQIILPGMEAMFAADDKPRTRCTSAEAQSYCSSIGLPAEDGSWFFDKMQGCGWKNGGQSVKDCYATIRAWKAAGYMASQKRAQSNGHNKPPEKHWSLKETEAELARLNKDQADFERRSAALRRSK